ncbi:MAG: hypothetical protein K9J74_07105 [Sulfuritalea sp.]|nr:hypothetical protein [Sulfuritalea sp.]
MTPTRIFRLWCLAFLLVFAGGVNATTKQTAPGPAGKHGHSSCGGLTSSGALETPCAAVPAIFEAAAVGSCPKDSFFDLGKWGCYSCPAGFQRGIDSIDTPKACLKNTNSPGKALPMVPGTLIPQLPATYTAAKLRGTACPTGSFFDPIRDGECYTCPSGYVRSAAHIDWADACVILSSVGTAKATKHSKAKGLDCPKGQFWDGYDGYCYSCPSTMVRSGNHITSAAACSGVVAGKQAKATAKGKAACKTGEFVDFLKNPKLGGNCYTCPENADRTTEPVTSNKACATLDNVEFAPAKLVAGLTCPADQIFDFAGIDTPALKTRILTQNRTVKPARVVPTKNGGTCWSCPTGYRRSVTAVWDSKACDSVGIGWVMPTYTQPGLFGLIGSDAVVGEIIKNDAKLIDEIALEILQSNSVPSSDPKVNELRQKKAILETWEEIRDTPQQSGPLMILAYRRMMNAAFNPATASAADKTLLNSFQLAVVLHRTYLAEQAYEAYTEWDQADFKRDDAYRALLIAGTIASLGVAAPAAIGTDLVKHGFNPMPDFASITLKSTLEDWAKGETQAFIIEKGLLSNNLQKTIFRRTAAEAKAARFALTGGAHGVAHEAFSVALKDYLKQRVLKQAVAEGATKATARVVLTAMKSLGPQIMVDAAIEAMTQWFQLHLDRANAGPDLKTKVAEAKREFSVARLDTAAGRGEVEGEWARMMGFDRAPLNPGTIKTAAEHVIKALPISR